MPAEPLTKCHRLFNLCSYLSNQQRSLLVFNANTRISEDQTAAVLSVAFLSMLQCVEKRRRRRRRRSRLEVNTSHAGLHNIRELLFPYLHHE